VSALGKKNQGLWIDPASSNNIFRSLVVHPLYSKNAATSLFVQYLANKQTESSDWGEGLHFYQTLNAMAHLEGLQVDRQLEMAFLRLIKTQNANGTWGVKEPEWNTFLAVHALKNKGLF
jgi:hypothetical protein